MLTLPTSGQVIGAVLRALRIASDDLASDGDEPSARTRRDYFEGRPVSAASRTAILASVCRAIVSMGPLAAARARLPGADVLLEILESYADQWDYLVTCWRVYDRTDAAQIAASTAILRVLTFDLGVRAAGLATMAGVSAPESTPEWARTAVAAEKPTYLAALLKRARLTRDDMIDRLDGRRSESALDQHLGGTRRPDSSTLDLYAVQLAKANPDVRDAELSAMLRSHFTLHALASTIAQVTGWTVVSQALDVFVRVWTTVAQGLAGAPEHLLRDGCLAHAAIGGAALRKGELAGRLASSLPDARWREAAYGADADWFNFMRFEIVRQERLGTEPFDWTQRPTSAASWSVHGVAALALLRDDVALEHFRRAVALAPDEPEYLMDLATALDGARIEDGPEGERARLAEALVAVRRAKELRPGWLEAQQHEALLVEALEGPEAGVRCLEALRRSRPAEEEDTLLRYHLAVVALQARRPSDALSWLKPMVERGSDHAEALALAAMCHAALGQMGRAQSQASRAAALGRPWPFPRKLP